MLCKTCLRHSGHKNHLPPPAGTGSHSFEPLTIKETIVLWREKVAEQDKIGVKEKKKRKITTFDIIEKQLLAVEIPALEDSIRELGDHVPQDVHEVIMMHIERLPI